MGPRSIPALPASAPVTLSARGLLNHRGSTWRGRGCPFERSLARGGDALEYAGRRKSQSNRGSGFVAAFSDPTAQGVSPRRSLGDDRSLDRILVRTHPCVLVLGSTGPVSRSGIGTAQTASEPHS